MAAYSPAPPAALPAEPVPVVGYVRVSKAREEMISPELQEAEITRGTRLAGRTVTRWIRDLDVTGRNFDRDVQKAIRLVEEGPEREIWVYRLDRWGRQTNGALHHEERLGNAGGVLVSTQEPSAGDTAFGNYIRTNQFALAQMQSDIIGENWNAVHRYRTGNGLPASGGPRFGYALLGRVPDEDHKHRTRHVKGEEERYAPAEDRGSEALARAYRSYLAGKGFHVIANELNAAGWQTTARRPWRSQGVRDVLDSGFGAGLLMVHDPACDCRRKAKAKCPRRAWLPGAHPPVITPREWEAYRGRRKLTAALPPRARSASYPLSGLARCGHCRSAMAVSGFGAGGAPVFVCTRYRSYKDCPGHPVVTVPRLDAAVRERAAAWAADVDAAAEREAARVKMRAGAEGEITRLEKLLAGREQMLVDLAVRRVTDTLLGDDAWAAAAAQARERRDEAAASLEAARERAARVPSPGLQPVMAGLMESWDILPAQALNGILRSLVRRVAVYRAGERRRNEKGHWEPAPVKVEVQPVWEQDPWEGEMPHVGRTPIL